MRKSLRTFAFLLVCTLFIILPRLCAEENLVYSISLSYNGKYLYLADAGVRLMEGTAPDRKIAPEDGFLLKVIAEDGRELHSFRFSIELQPVFQPLRQDVPSPPSPKAEPTYTSFVLTVPYFATAKSIEIYNTKSELLLTVDVSRFAAKQRKTEQQPQNVPPAGGGTNDFRPLPRGGTGDGIPLSLGFVAVGMWILRKFWALLLLAGILGFAYRLYQQKKNQKK